VRRSPFLLIAAIVTLIAAQCLQAVNLDHARRTSVSNGRHHVGALRAMALQRTAPWMKAAPDRVQPGMPAFDLPARLLLWSSTASIAVHTTLRLAAGVVGEFPGACRPPPSLA
jgi:hypothetical protein